MVALRRFPSAPGRLPSLSGAVLGLLALLLSAGPVAAQSAPGPSTVAVDGQPYRFTYLVNGEPQVIRGMGYNVMYAHLPPEERARRYDRDFARLRRMGVNTIVGWLEEEFDGLLLDRAQAHGLGVVMPYHLYPILDYANPEVRLWVTQRVLEWVATYRDHPAVRMWGIGNEVLLHVVQPSWSPSPNPPAAVARARAFAQFYVELADRVHEFDPAHPVLARDAEVGYLRWLRDALRARPAARPWLIYGMNAYTARLAEVVERWPSYQLGLPLLVSEFAPLGLGPEDRPAGYRAMWEVVRRRPEWTLGGVPYVWTTHGPEEIDDRYGLVDREGEPVDGALEAIASMYAQDQAAAGPSLVH